MRKAVMQLRSNYLTSITDSSDRASTSQINPWKVHQGQLADRTMLSGVDFGASSTETEKVRSQIIKYRISLQNMGKHQHNHCLYIYHPLKDLNISPLGWWIRFSCPRRKCHKIGLQSDNTTLRLMQSSEKFLWSYAHIPPHKLKNQSLD